MRAARGLIFYTFVKKEIMKTAFQNEVVFRIKLLREKNGYSQSRIAELLGLSSG